MYGEAAQDIIRALKDGGIFEAQGSIKLDLFGVEVKLNDKSAVGNILQEWLGCWMKKNGFYYRENENTQIPPDFYLSENSEINLLEIKSFDCTKAPNFDVAAFDAFARSLRTNAFRLDADYLIFGYTMREGVLSINKIWLKKIWEITCPSEKYALRTQNKQNIIYNIRPYNFNRMSRGFQPFKSRRDFVLAFRDTLSKYKNDPRYSEDWFHEVVKSYQKFAHSDI